MPLIKWTIVRLVVFQKTTGAVTTAKWNHRKEPLILRLFRPEKTTLGLRVHVQTVGLNAETKKDRDRADGEVFLLTLPLIGLRRFPRYQALANLSGVYSSRA